MSLRPQQRVWFHGTARDFEEFEIGRMSRTNDFGTRLGIHFSSSADTAFNFATWLYRDRNQEEPKVGYLMACRLRLKRPLNFASEKGLGIAVRRFGIKAELLPEGFMTPPKPYSTLSAELYWSWGSYSEHFLKLKGVEELAVAYVRHCKEQGYDGITYGNSSEREFSRYKEPTAIVFDVDQIRVIEKKKVSVEETTIGWSKLYRQAGVGWKVREDASVNEIGVGIV